MKLLQPTLQFVRKYWNKTILLHFQKNFLCAWNFYVVLPIDPYHKSALSNSSGWWGFDLTKNDNELQIAIDLGTCEVVALLLKMFDQLRTSIHDMDASVATIVAVDHTYYFYWTQVKSLATRVEVCHLCRDRRSCKICIYQLCNFFFSRKQGIFLHNFVEVQDLQTPSVILRRNC